MVHAPILSIESTAHQRFPDIQALKAQNAFDFHVRNADLDDASWVSTPLKLENDDFLCASPSDSQSEWGSTPDTPLSYGFDSDIFSIAQPQSQPMYLKALDCVLGHDLDEKPIKTESLWHTDMPALEVIEHDTSFDSLLTQPESMFGLPDICPLSRLDMIAPSPLSSSTSASSGSARMADDRAQKRSKTIVAKRRAESEMESMEVKKARARQTRDEITAKTQAALRNKVDNPEMKRITHNVLERKRREELKVSYNELRSFLPDLIYNERAPTGQILNKAVEYINELKAEDKQLCDSIAAMRAENDRLRARLM